MLLRNRVSCQPLAFGGPATVLGKDVHQRGSLIGRWSAIVLNVLPGSKVTLSISREFTPGFRDFQNLLTLRIAPRIAGERVAFRGLSSILLDFPHNAGKLNTSKRRWSMPDIAERRPYGADSCEPTGFRAPE